MKPSVYIFPGMNERPKLYYDIQALVSKNGGRLKLAESLDNERVKSYLPKQYSKHGYVRRWPESKINMLISLYNENASKEHIGLIVGKTKGSVWSMIHRLRLLNKIV